MTAGLDALRTLAEGLDHPEGVAVTADGILYAGGEAGQIYRIDAEKGSAEQVATTGGFLLGLCADLAGRLYACDLERREVLRVDPATGSVDVYSRGTPERPMVTPNWALFDDDGNLYVTDSGTWKADDGCIMRVSPAGVTEVWSTTSSRFPNGACLNAKGDAVLVIESLTPALVRIPILADGQAGAREVVTSLTGVPDGVALDEEGNAYVFSYRPDRIDRVAPDGSVTTLAEDPQGTVLAAPTNGTWFGPDRRTLVVANLGRWHLSAFEPGPRGLALRYPKLHEMHV